MPDSVPLAGLPVSKAGPPVVLCHNFLTKAQPADHQKRASGPLPGFRLWVLGFKVTAGCLGTGGRRDVMGLLDLEVLIFVGNANVTVLV